MTGSIGIRLSGNDFLGEKFMPEIDDAPNAPLNTHPKLITGLAEMSSKTLIDEDALAHVLGVSKRTVRRMVARFELPPPIALAGRATWISGHVLAHIEARAERAARKAEQEARRIEALPFKIEEPKILQQQ